MAAGSSDTVVTINGSDFVEATKVTLDGAAVEEVGRAGNQLVVTVPAAKLAAAPAEIVIVVSNPEPGGGTAEETLAVVAAEEPTVPEQGAET